MTSALGVSAMVFNVGRMVGPAIAGLVLAYLSEAWCFALNAVSYAGIIAALLAMRLPAEAPRPTGGVGAQSFAASMSVILAFPAVRYLLPTVVAVGLFATPYVPLMPSIVAHFFDGQSSTVGLLMSAAAIGALGSAGYLSLQPRYGRQIRLMTIAPLVVGIALALFAWSRTLPLSALLLAALGGAALLGVNATNAMLQQSVPDEWRGRVIGVYSMSFAGTAPIGGLLSGWMADRFGLTTTLTLNGVADRRGRAGGALAPAQPPRGPARPDAQPDEVEVKSRAAAARTVGRQQGGGEARPPAPEIDRKERAEVIARRCLRFPSDPTNAGCQMAAGWHREDTNLPGYAAGSSNVCASRWQKQRSREPSQCQSGPTWRGGLKRLFS